MPISLQADSTAPRGYVLVDGSNALTIGLTGITTPGIVDYDWTVTSASINLSRSTRYAINTTAASLTCTLPANPTVGDWVYVADAAGTWNTNNLIIARNGNLIASVADTLACDVNYSAITLVFVGGSVGWQVCN